MNDKAQDSNGTVDANARLVTSDIDKAKAAKWFQRARELGDKRQFDYAIEYYVNGLEFWPDAVEEACKALHGCGVARRQTGGKKPGLKDTMKRSLTDKDPKKAFLNSMWLFGKEPENHTYVEAIVRNASRLRAEDVCKWAAGIAIKNLESAPKPTSKQFQQLATLIEEAGDRAAERGESAFAVSVFQMGVDLLNLWRRRISKDQSVTGALKNLSTKLTILKGKYQKGDSYRDSIANSEQQEQRHDEERTVQSEERVDELIASAERAYQEDPDKPGALKKLVDWLCRQERDDYEVRAIGLLVDQYKRTGDYRWKKIADDIRIKQLARAVRTAAKSGDAEETKKQQVAQLRFELSVYKDRIEKYPTDNRVKFEYGVRCFRAGRFDDAIPLFQAARADLKNRVACGLFLGRCFFRKGFPTQAVSALEEAISQHDMTDDDLSKNLHYWLARAQDEAKQPDEARKTYGKILQMDYNYRDVRDRLEALGS